MARLKYEDYQITLVRALPNGLKNSPIPKTSHAFTLSNCITYNFII